MTAIETEAGPALTSRDLTARPQADASAIIAEARRAQIHWSSLTPTQRANGLAPLASLIADRTDEIAQLLHDENGKPLTEAIVHEVFSSVQLVNHDCAMAPEALSPTSIRLPLLPHRKPVISRKPYGVILAISPWNLPWIIPMSQVLPALLAGNAVILKPSELTPRTALLLADVFTQLDLPKGLLQVVPGDGSTGAKLIEARPDKVLFTGSVATGRAVMRSCAQFPIPVGLELGGVDAMIVRGDADLEFAASAVAWGGTFNGGQACCSVERLLVHESIADALRARIVDKLTQIDPHTELAPAIDDRQFSTWQRHLDDALSRGLLAEPEPEQLPRRLMTPRLISGPDVSASDIWRNETFGPLVAMQTFSDDDEAVAKNNASHNDNPFGLTASIITSDPTAGRLLAQRLRAGVIAINDVAATLYGSPEVPWGGVGGSGFGRSHGKEGLLESSWAQVIEEPKLLNYGPKRPWWYPYDAEQAAGLAAITRAFGQQQVKGRLLGLAKSLPTIMAPLSRRPRL
jgi:acyl-CoA reductase-like NAD-dependent aldehyde dehydrogenase